MSELVNVAFKSFNSENIKYANSEKPKICLNLLGGEKIDIYIKLGTRNMDMTTDLLECHIKTTFQPFFLPWYV